MKLIKTLVMIVAVALPLVLVAAPMGGSGKMGMMNMPMMKTHMAEMKADMGKMAAAKNDGERVQIMQAHMAKMHDHMEMMMGMMEMMNTQGGGMHAGAPAAAAPGSDADGQHAQEPAE